MKDRILSLLGSGLAPSLVSSAVGCSESYISQLLKDSSFALEVASLRCKEMETLKLRDSKWDSLEDALLEKLENLIPYMLRPREVLHALQVVNNAKRRSQELLQGQQVSNVTNNFVLLQLPSKTVNTYEISRNNEVISVEGKALIPMPTSQLMKEVSQSSQSFLSELPKEKEKENASISCSTETSRKTEENSDFTEAISERIASADAV